MRFAKHYGVLSYPHGRRPRPKILMVMRGGQRHSDQACSIVGRIMWATPSCKTAHIALLQNEIALQQRYSIIEMDGKVCRLVSVDVCIDVSVGQFFLVPHFALLT